MVAVKRYYKYWQISITSKPGQDIQRSVQVEKYSEFDGTENIKIKEKFCRFP